MQNLGRYILLVFIIITTLYAVEQKKFSFEMKADKTTAYLGEPIKITFVFKYPIEIQIAEANFAPPTFHNFWTKAGENVPNTIKNNYHIYRLDYIVTPQKAGKLEIEPARMDIGILKTKQKNTLRFERVKWKSIFSNSLNIDVKPLPENVNLFGSYQISATIDKNITKANEPVNLTITVTGNGNIDDIEDFVIKSDIAAVYSDKAKRHIQFQKGFPKAVMRQKFAFISDKNFTIPAISLTYFDGKSKQIKTIQTKAIPIQIIQTAKSFMTPRLEKKTSTLSFSKKQTPSSIFWILSILGAFLAGVIVTSFWNSREKFSGNKKDLRPIEGKIKKAKSDKELLALLLPYSGKSRQIDTIIDQLEANLYEKSHYRINRKSLAKKFAEYVTIIQKDTEILL